MDAGPAYFAILTLIGAGIVITFVILERRGGANRSKSAGSFSTPIGSSPVFFNSVRDAMVNQMVSNPPPDTNLLLLERLYESSLDGFVTALENQISFLANRKISEKLRFCLRFESLVYLGFYSDCYGFSANQSEEGRLILSDDIFDNRLMQPFYAEDPSLKGVVDSRLSAYVARVKSGRPGTSDPWATFLNYISLAAQEETIDRTGKISLADMFARAADWTSIGTNPGFILFLKSLAGLWKKTDDISSMNTEDMRKIILTELRTASMPKT